MSSVLVANNLQKTYGQKSVVKGVSVGLSSGEVVGLLGPNGAGKTTTFYMIVGLVSPSSGDINLAGHDITKLPMYKRARLGIGYLPQEPSIFRRLSVKDNIYAVLETLPLSKRGRLDRLEELLVDLGLTRVRDAISVSLSGGERRRLEIARALACNPSFILLDEPFAGIDPIAIKEIQSMILSLKEKGIGLLITDHNVRETLGICDRSYIMVDGKVLESGTRAEVANSERARRFYLGDDFAL